MTSRARPWGRCVAVISHLPRFDAVAIALHRAGLLHHYLSMPVRVSPVVQNGTVRRARLPGIRSSPGLVGVPRKTLWATASVSAISKVIPPARGFRDPVLSSEAARTLRRAIAIRVMHAPHGIGRQALEEARRCGVLSVVELRALHPIARESLIAGVLERRRLAFEHSPQSKISEWIAQAEMADFLVANSELTRKSYVDAGFDPERVLVLHPAAPQVPDSEPREVDPESVRLLFVGRAFAAKGLHDLADALRDLPATWTLDVVGPSPREVAGALANVPQNVATHGNLPFEDMAQRYRDSDVLLLPSLSDGFGMAAVEAMASGIPVVVSDQCGVAEIIEDGVAGWVVPAGDHEALRDRLRSFLDDPRVLEVAGRAARSAAMGIGPAAHAERLVAMYEEVFLPASQ